MLEIETIDAFLNNTNTETSVGKDSIKTSIDSKTDLPNNLNNVVKDNKSSTPLNFINENWKAIITLFLVSIGALRFLYTNFATTKEIDDLKKNIKENTDIKLTSISNNYNNKITNLTNELNRQKCLYTSLIECIDEKNRDRCLRKKSNKCQ